MQDKLVENFLYLLTKSKHNFTYFFSGIAF